MIEYVKMDIFDSPADALVNPVNTVGVMRDGLALRFKRAYPEMFRYYRVVCNNRELHPGWLNTWKGRTGKRIINFPTKRNWQEPSKIEYIESGLRTFTARYQKWGIKSVSFPKLGCDLDGLEWEDINPLMEIYLGSLPITIYIHV